MPHADTSPPFDAYPGDEPYLFAAYGHADAAQVYPILKFLHEKGYRIWYDEGIDPGNDWHESIGGRVISCAQFVVFLSPRAVESHNVLNEIHLACEHRKPCLPIYLERTNLPPGLALEIGRLQAILRHHLAGDRFERALRRALPTSLCQAPLDIPVETPAPASRPHAPAPEAIAVAPTPRARKAAEANYIEAHGGLNLEMVWLPGGEFQMGSNDSDASGDEKPVHSVSLDGFWIGKYEVTQRQYEALMGSDPSRFKGADWPVDTVSWNNATAFCRKLSSVTGKAYLLPTEAQWEYACRAGSAGKWCFGSDESQLGKYAWFDRNSGSQTHPVGQKQPNAWRLFDMHGNVWEWCGDWYADSYSGALSERNPTGPNSGTFRVLRGGSWVSYPGGCRSAYRSWFGPGDRVGINGFRVVRTQK